MGTKPLVALITSGGGSNGDWETGVLKALAEHGLVFGYYGGTSVGAIIAAALAMFPSEEFPQAVEYITRIWRENPDQMWEYRTAKDLPWRAKPIYYLLPKEVRKYLPGLFHPSLGLATGVEALLLSELKLDDIKSSGVQLKITAVDLPTGEIVTYDEQSTDIDAIMASSSFPGFFAPVEKDGMFLTDGGVRAVAHLGAAIKAGAREIWVVITRDPYTAPPANEEKLKKNVINLLRRTISLMHQEILLTDVEICRMTNELVTAGVSDKKLIDLHVIFPSKKLGNSLKFNAEKFEKQNAQGYEDGIAYLKGLK